MIIIRENKRIPEANFPSEIAGRTDIAIFIQDFKAMFAKTRKCSEVTYFSKTGSALFSVESNDDAGKACMQHDVLTFSDSRGLFFARFNILKAKNIYLTPKYGGVLYLDRYEIIFQDGTSLSFYARNN